MTLINCPDCHKPVSDKADKCPNCGHPVNLDHSPANDLSEGDDDATPGKKLISHLREQFGWGFMLICLLLIFLMALAFVVLCRGLIGIFGG